MRLILATLFLFSISGFSHANWEYVNLWTYGENCGAFPTSQEATTACSNYMSSRYSNYRCAASSSQVLSCQYQGSIIWASQIVGQRWVGANPPPLQCEVGFSPNPSYTECVFSGCPSNYFQVGQSCHETQLPDDGFLQCDSSGVCRDQDYDLGCSIFSSTYIGNNLSGKPLCSDNIKPEDCDGGFTFGYVNDVLITSCKSNLTDYQGNPEYDPLNLDNPNSPFGCSDNQYKVGDKCVDVETTQGDTSTKRTYNEDGTYTDTTTTTTQTKKSDGTIDKTTTTKTDNYGADGDLIDSDTKTEEEKTQVTGGNTCDSAPVCTGDAGQCAILKQTFLTRCAVENSTEKSTVSGGGSCDSPPVCKGDAVQCASLGELHRIRCSNSADSLTTITDGDIDTSALDNFDFVGLENDIESGVNSSLADVNSKFGVLIDEYGGESSSLVTDIDLTDYSFVDGVELVSGSCPASFVFDLGAFGEIPFDMSAFCTLLGYIGFLVRLSASLLAVRLTFKTISEL